MLIQVAHALIEDYAIPKGSIRGPYNFNFDASMVDHRYFKRYRRKAIAQWEAWKRSPAGLAQKRKNEELLRQFDMEFRTRNEGKLLKDVR